MTDLHVLGRIVVTTGAFQACKMAGMEPMTFLERHASGDRGDRDGQSALEGVGVRMKSSYPLDTGKTVWVITEADRLVTLILLPNEF